MMTGRRSTDGTFASAAQRGWMSFPLYLGTSSCPSCCPSSSRDSGCVSASLCNVPEAWIMCCRPSSHTVAGSLSCLCVAPTLMPLLGRQLMACRCLTYTKHIVVNVLCHTLTPTLGAQALRYTSQFRLQAAPSNHLQRSSLSAMFQIWRCTQEEDWRARESAILALGAISEGCAGGLLSHLSEMVNVLLPKLLDSRPLVRSITCWALSRYSHWIVQASAELNGPGQQQFDTVIAVCAPASCQPADVCRSPAASSSTCLCVLGHPWCCTMFVTLLLWPNLSAQLHLRAGAGLPCRPSCRAPS
jgi:hypothetical protein